MTGISMRCEGVYPCGVGKQYLFAGGFNETAIARVRATARCQSAADCRFAIGPDSDATSVAGVDRIGIDIDTAIKRGVL